MRTRDITVLTSALLVLAGTAVGQTTGGTSGGTSGGQTGGSGGAQSGGTTSGNRTTQQNQANRDRTNQLNQQNQNQQPSQPTRQELLESGRAVGDRSVTGDGIGTRSQPGGADLTIPGPNEQFFPPVDGTQNQLPRGTDPRLNLNTNESLNGVNLNGLIRNGQLDQNFVRNMTPAQRDALARQLGGGFNDFDGGSGQVQMSNDRFNRLYGDRNQQGQNGAWGGAGGYGQGYGNADLATSLQRLALLEQQMMEQNDRLLRRLGQARQMSEERQVRAIADVMQEMIQQRGQLLSYMGELRYAVSEQAGFDSAPAVDARVAPRSYAAPERSEWDYNDRRTERARRDTPNLTPYRSTPATEMYDEEGRRWR